MKIQKINKIISFISLFMLLAQIFVLSIPSALAVESTGFRSPSVVNTSGSGQSWLNPSNGIISDDSRASVSNIWLGQTSNSLKFSNFGFNIPEDATINSVKLEVEKRKRCLIASCNNKLLDSEISLFVDGGNFGGNKASGIDWKTSDSVSSYSWGSVLSPSKINESDFGVSISVISYSNNAWGQYTAYIDSVKIAVEYTPKDKVAPSISGTPTNITKEATGPGGAVVSYVAPTATDVVDGIVPVSCSRASGSIFPLGQTTVTCAASDVAGNASSSSFKITVRDTTPPEITAPESIEALADTFGGKKVSFDVSAHDLVDGDVKVVCSKDSGSLFVVGETNVSCEAEDRFGNKSEKNFKALVLDEERPVISLSGEDDVVMEYGGEFTDPGASWTDIVDGEGVVINVSGSVNPLAVGTYVLRYNFLDSSNNQAEEKIRTVKIIPKKITITAFAQEKEAGESDPLLTHKITAGNLLDGDVLTGSLLRSPGETVGQYEILLGTLSAGENYEIIYQGAKLTILPKVVSTVPLTSNNDPLTSGNRESDRAIQATSIEKNSAEVAEVKGAVSADSKSVESSRAQKEIKTSKNWFFLLWIFLFFVGLFLVRSLVKKMTSKNPGKL